MLGFASAETTYVMASLVTPSRSAMAVISASDGCLLPLSMLARYPAETTMSLARMDCLIPSASLMALIAGPCPSRFLIGTTMDRKSNYVKQDMASTGNPALTRHNAGKLH